MNLVLKRTQGTDILSRLVELERPFLAEFGDGSYVVGAYQPRAGEWVTVVSEEGELTLTSYPDTPTMDSSELMIAALAENYSVFRGDKVTPVTGVNIEVNY